VHCSERKCYERLCAEQSYQKRPWAPRCVIACCCDVFVISIRGKCAQLLKELRAAVCRAVVSEAATGASLRHCVLLRCVRTRHLWKMCAVSERAASGCAPSSCNRSGHGRLVASSCMAVKDVLAGADSKR
jgi:hypothetical protein